jgi:hypothetical protein
VGAVTMEAGVVGLADRSRAENRGPLRTRRRDVPSRAPDKTDLKARSGLHHA